ncbi:DUF7507 domain-containing protein [Amycolatopsis benzoatilytica]|uniref:DUF7507 domain-containing protein n=1 Tax=Amycolatopsis benzoatilytica TaxID=346045 RepID=UPI001B7FAA60|nr:DUF11 domain-containing protein [Amycolatopsis benzoatilytica]
MATLLTPAAHAESFTQNARQVAYGDFLYASTAVDKCADSDCRTSAAVTVPSGSTVAYARLAWGGAATPKCASTARPVRFSVDGGAATTVSPGSADGGNGFYSAGADVTSSFAGVATGRPVQLSAARVTAGPGCSGGWSVAVIYTYPQRNPEYAPEKRAIYLYDGPGSDAVISGFRAASPAVRMGVTRFSAGEPVLLNGQPVSPSSPGETDSFSARTFSSQAVPAGATSARVSLPGARNLAFSVPVQDLQVSMTAEPRRVHAGDQVSFTVSVTNPAAVALSDVDIVDEQNPQCSKKIGTLAAGATSRYQCGFAAPDHGFASTVQVTGVGSGGDQLSASASSRVDVLRPAVTLKQQVDKPAYRVGDQVTFALKTTNSGDVPLHDVAIADPGVPSCARVLGTLAPGQTVVSTCTATAPLPNGASATVRGSDPLGKVVDATADVPVPVIAPALSVSKTPVPPVVHGGDKVTWNVMVRNTGDSPVDQLTVADDGTPACSRPIGRLAPDAEQTYSCTANPDSTTTNTVTVAGTDLSGRPVTAKSSATVTVIHPALAVTAVSSPRQVREGDRVTFTVTVRNAGDVPLDAVAVADDRVPGCVRTFGTMVPGDVQTYKCEQLAPAEDATNTVVATGKDQLGTVQRATADARIDVLHPALALTAAAAPAQVREGDQVTFTITVRNSGDAELHDVALADDRLPDCARQLGTLGAQGNQTVTCKTTAGAQGFTNDLTATGTDSTRRPVSATASASFTVQHPAVSLSATAQNGPFREGDSVPMRIVVTNTGDVPLAGLAVTTLARAEGCAQHQDGLAPRATWTFDCTTTAPGSDVTEAVQVTAKPPVGAPVTSAAEAAIDVIHPLVTLTHSVAPAVVRPGEPATFTLTVANAGDTELHDVEIADPNVPECGKRLGTLAPHVNQTYTCVHAAADDVTSAATVTGTDPSGRPVTAAAEAKVDVIHPAIAISQTAAPAQVREGDQVTFTITVRNSGDVSLAKLSIVDDRTPACAREFPALAAGAEQKYSCTIKAGQDGYSNTAKATAADPLGGTVAAAADATFSVVHPGLALTKTVHGGPFRAGDPVTFTLTVANTGDAPLAAVAVADQGPCARALDTIAPGAKKSYDCTIPAPTDDAVSTAHATGTPPAGPPLTAAADAKIDVIHPALTIRTTATPSVVRAGDQLTVTVAVTNTGDVPLTGVTSNDPGCVKKFEQLAPGAAQTYQCLVKAKPDDFTVTAGLTGTDPTGRPVTASAAAKVDVIHPDIAIMKDAQPYQVRQGDRVTFSLLVRNVGDVPLTGVSVVDDRTKSCSHTVAVLAPEAEDLYKCTITAGSTGFTNTAKVTGTDPTQRTVDGAAQASFEVKKPAMAVAKRATGGPFRAGGTVPFEVVLTNTGDQPLHDVRVADQRADECARTFADLPVGGIQRYPCMAPADAGSSAATATAAAPWGPPVTATGPADYTVLHPAVELRRDHLRQPIRPGDPVTYISTVRNSGDAPLHEVAVRDPDPACSFTLRSLAPGEQTSRACTLVARADATTTTTVTALDQTGRPVEKAAMTTTDVTGPGLTVTASGPPQPVLAGRPTPVQVTVTNTGDVPLTDVRAVGPGCSSAPADLLPGASVPDLTCAVTAPGTVTATGRTVSSAPAASTAVAGGNSPAGATMVRAETTVWPNTAQPGVSLVERGDDTVAPGGPLTFVVTAANTGTAPLSVAGHRLLPGDQWQWTRTATAPAGGQAVDTVMVRVEPAVTGASAFTVCAGASVPVGVLAAAEPRPLPATDLDLLAAALAALALVGSGALLVRVTRRSS